MPLFGGRYLALPLHLGHCNFAPDDLSRAVDKWHTDTIGLDYVLMVSDPQEQVGGEFQYFLGTKDEVDNIKKEGELLPKDRVVSPNISRPRLHYCLTRQHGSS